MATQDAMLFKAANPAGPGLARGAAEQGGDGAKKRAVASTAPPNPLTTGANDSKASSKMKLGAAAAAATGAAPAAPLAPPAPPAPPAPAAAAAAAAAAPLPPPPPPAVAAVFDSNQSGLIPTATFACDITHVRAQLEEHGVAVVHGVLDAAALIKMREGMWDMLGHVTAGLPGGYPQITKDPTTWRTLKALGPSEGMILQTFRLGQAQVAWDVRQSPGVNAVFAAIWGCEPRDLLCSVDAVFVQFPPETAPGKFYSGEDWFHRDQRLHASDALRCVQGSVSAFDVMPGDAAFACYPGSHKLTAALTRLADPTKVSSMDWVKMNERQLNYLDEHCKRVNIACPAGSLILWDSRTVHCGCLPQRGRPHKDHMRFVVPVCALPRKHFQATLSKVLQKKVEIVMGDQRCTTHWPDARRLFPVSPFRGSADRAVKAHLGNAIRFPDPVLTPLGYTLAGFQPSIATKATSLAHALELYKADSFGVKPLKKRAAPSASAARTKAKTDAAAVAANQRDESEQEEMDDEDAEGM